MSARKQQLLRRHRRHKRLAVGAAVLVLLLLALTVAWWLLPLMLLLGWIAHEAWFADHLFYAPDENYQYAFPAGTPSVAATLSSGCLQLSEEVPAGDTLILQLQVRSTWLGRWLDPYVLLGDDRQDFERGVRGERYLNLSGQLAVMRAGEQAGQ